MNVLTETTQQILQVATGTMILSGLNLAVSSVGFAVLGKKLNNLEGKLTELAKDVKAIRSLWEIDERSKLTAALRDLWSIDKVESIEHRNALLLNAKNILAPISIKYKELLAEADTIELAMANEEYYCLTTLAHARCLAELGMFQAAKQDLQEAKQYWTDQAQHIANDFILGNDPERFLCSDLSQNATSAEIIEWLDFSSGEERGYGWLDDLRSNSQPWHQVGTFKGICQGFRVIKMNLKSKLTGNTKTTLAREKSILIPSIQKLVARDKVLEGFVSQYDFLEKNNLKPKDFDRQIGLLAETESVDDFLILQPVGGG